MFGRIVWKDKEGIAMFGNKVGIPMFGRIRGEFHRLKG